MLLLDGYNVLHCSHVLPDRYAMVDPAGLCALIRRSGLAGGGARVVCDGVRKPHEALDAGEAGVRLVYAGPGRDADTLLEQMIANDTRPRQLVVVSNDNRIRRAARRRRGAQALHCEPFLRSLAARLRRAAPPAPQEKPSCGDADAWLRTFGLDTDAEPGPEPEAEPIDSETRYWLRVFGYDDDAD